MSTYVFEKDGECTCHNNPPCSACVGSYLVCPTCSYTPDSEWGDEGD